MIDLLTQSLANIARDIPGATSILHHYKLDFCCKGDNTLSAAAKEKGLDTEVLLIALEKLQQRHASPEKNAEESMQEEWKDASTEQLIEHILIRYHDVHREQFPELIRMASRVERVHGGHPACPAGLTASLEKLSEKLEQHMAKEEQILFPMFARNINGMAQHPIQLMRSEHHGHGEDLKHIAKLTDHYHLPDGACNTWQALYKGLQAMQEDLMNHIHFENNLLFTSIEDKAGKTDA